MEECGGEVETASLPFSSLPSMFDTLDAQNAPTQRLTEPSRRAGTLRTAA